ncbi:uncharacterized protein LOC112679818 [Sipha flava]|uniref:Uncharacterized protein LOC112679818 n=1 Tax=Sipha flava TaxID=143950 RepID=A0A2S2QNS6_9HEMI|nr:uncharacterized protein LOC112679818 [Sipha flava]XP_025405523.1 uncharacterized protein LOC112679818 [Sipha flava]
MPPTIQCFDDQSMHMPPATVLCGGLFYQENHQTSASDRVNPSPGVRTNTQWNPCLRNRNSTFNIKRNTSYSSPLKLHLKRLLDNLPEESVVTEEHLDVIRKRTALMLLTIQTMTLFHHNQILENKLSALHKRVTQIQKDRKNNNESATK